MESLQPVQQDVFKKPYAPVSSAPVGDTQTKVSTATELATIERLTKENAKLRQDLTVFQLKSDYLTGLLVTITNSPLSVSQLHPKGRYFGQITNGKHNGLGVYTSFDGGYYIGEWSDNVFHGMGTLVDSLGTYEGSFQQGVRHGKGRQQYANGEYRNGFWENNQFIQGRGKFSNAFGVYEGECWNGMRHGSGTQYCPDGERFEGTWKDDKWEGGAYYRNAIHVKQPRRAGISNE